MRCLRAFTIPIRENRSSLRRVASSPITAHSMEFWGVEVKFGQSITVGPGVESIIHLSQACLVDVKMDNEKDKVYLYVNTENQKLCIGALSADKFPQIAFDLVFDKEFELSHTSKSGSVHLCGYKTNISDYNSEDIANTTINAAKTGNFAAEEHKREEVLEPSRKLNHDSDDSSADEDTPLAKKVSGKEDESDDEDDSDESDDEDESEDESDEDESNKEAQNKPIQSNKRENDSVQVPVPTKKAKLVTREKNDAKKSGGHVATPYPSKLVKAAGNSDKSKQQSQKTGEFRCNPCNRTFGSENALLSHSKAKHG